MADRRHAVLVTGCSSGIGRHVARGLHSRGYRVLATARADSDLEQLQSEGLEAIPLDLDDPESVTKAGAEALNRCAGAPYALFNNAGWGLTGAVEDLTREALRAQFETNLFGPVQLTNLLIPAMRHQGRGRIINNSSVLGLVALPFRGAYNASKFALEGLTDTLRLELAHTGVHVSLIEPGPIVSRFRANAYRAFRRYIDAERSVHRATYRAVERRLTASDRNSVFTRTPEAVFRKVVHALESPRPRPRYYVTAATPLLAFLRRALPTRALDWVSMRAGA